MPVGETYVAMHRCCDSLRFSSSRKLRKLGLDLCHHV
jgi:hypothetical protein